jgi:molecular chaperone GrpE
MPDKTEDSLPSKGAEQPPNDDASEHDERAAPAATDKRVEELTDLVKRTQAEFENYKKRVEREWTEKSRFAAERVIVDLLAILDTLDSAIESSHPNAKGQETGLEGIRRQLMQVLQRSGMKEIDTEGLFNPFLHEALMREETTDEEDGQILEVFQKGYMLGPKVIRAARVKVSVGASNNGTDVSCGGSKGNETDDTDDNHEGD